MSLLPLASNRDYLDQRFGSLTVLSTWTVRPESGTMHLRCRALCDCGSIREYRLNNLRAGRTQRCLRCPLRPKRTTHKFDERVRGRWRRLRKRHTVAKTWENFETFQADVGSFVKYHTVRPLDGTKRIGPGNFEIVRQAADAVFGPTIRVGRRDISQKQAAELLGVSLQRVHSLMKLRPVRLRERLAEAQVSRTQSHPTSIRVERAAIAARENSAWRLTTTFPLQ
ncbi:MAG: hypothetical protein KDA75_02210 [Planctomycetaceae bacterium]|nr:hypothetical protein [Planctomycetaceae bacterium]